MLIVLFYSSANYKVAFRWFFSIGGQTCHNKQKWPNKPEGTLVHITKLLWDVSPFKTKHIGDRKHVLLLLRFRNGSESQVQVPYKGPDFEFWVQGEVGASSKYFKQSATNWGPFKRIPARVAN